VTATSACPVAYAAPRTDPLGRIGETLTVESDKGIAEYTVWQTSQVVADDEIAAVPAPGYVFVMIAVQIENVSIHDAYLPAGEDIIWLAANGWCTPWDEAATQAVDPDGTWMMVNLIGIPVGQALTVTLVWQIPESEVVPFRLVVGTWARQPIEVTLGG
jgi:hypothetical protein